jgi:hypothetical protein
LTSNFPVYDGWHGTTQTASDEERRRGVQQTFLKKAQNRKVVSAFDRIVHEGVAFTPSNENNRLGYFRGNVE